MLHSRMERVQNQLQTAIAEIIDREMTNPNLPEWITVSHVKVSKDLSRALVLVTLLDDQTKETIKETVDELNRSAGFIGRQVARRVTLKRHPHLRFAYNGSTRYAADIDQFFHQIREEQEGEG